MNTVLARHQEAMNRTCCGFLSKFCAMWEESAVEEIKLIGVGEASHGSVWPIPEGHCFRGLANVLSLMRLGPPEEIL